jgi:hypothetical protein
VRECLQGFHDLANQIESDFFDIESKLYYYPNLLVGKKQRVGREARSPGASKKDSRSFRGEKRQPPQFEGFDPRVIPGKATCRISRKVVSLGFCRLIALRTRVSSALSGCLFSNLRAQEHQKIRARETEETVGVRKLLILHITSTEKNAFYCPRLLESPVGN